MEAKEKKPVLMDYIYQFQSIKKGERLKLNSKSKIFLIINEAETAIPIEDVFLGKIDIDDDEIEGYSILQMVTDKTKLKIDSDTTLDITFIDKVSGKQFYISKIRRRIMIPGYRDDIEITTENRIKYIDLLLSTTIAVPAEPSQEIVVSPEQAAAAEKAAATAEAAAQDAIEAQKIAKAKLKEEEELAEKLAEEKRIEEEKIKADAEEAANVLGGLDWETERKDPRLEGLTEYQYGNYRFFYGKKDGDETPEIAFFILTPGDFYSIELYEEDIIDGIETYYFEDSDDKEWVVTFNSTEGKLLVEEAKVSS